MPMDRSLYPNNWETIALAIKTAANWTCEECGKQCRRPGQSWDEFEDQIRDTPWADDYWEEYHDDETGEWGDVSHPKRFVLTVSHTDHNPANCDRDNLRALCAPCHCRYDVQPFSMAIKKRLKAEREGQLTLEGVLNG